MLLQENHFKNRLNSGECQFGLWLGLPNPICAEISATAGFDWLLIDAEHAPYSLQDIQQHLQALSPYRSAALVRPAEGSSSNIKQLLDLGCQTLLIPMVEHVEQAQALAEAMRYPPQGIRGLGTSMARAARWNGISNYVTQANDNVCLIIQVETRTGLENLDALLSVEGIEGVFIGPSDLSASLGFIGQADHPTVRAAIDSAIHKIKASGKACGLLSVSQDMARHYQKCGVDFIGVGVDAALLAQSVRALAEDFCDQDAGPTAGY
ncbi:HpcH/HpaI aldolase/citrate lyase family protein [Pseudoteredinibacter isoporae]|uniref:HpcH/HpaI aldolase/citrate lyase family protein n=1 Tax=Pseudoteredinibacter isoporae TaxID=570281 RepID=UPI0031084B1F